MCIVHIVQRDKFTSGYINFMKIYMNEYHHHFIVLKKEQELKVVNQEGMVFVEDFCSKLDQATAHLLSCAEMIIVTGVFSSFQILRRLPKRILSKTYLHFWGAEFYGWAENQGKRSIKENLRFQIRKKCFKRCAGYIFLIDGEYENFQKIFGIKKRHFIAPMPDDPCKDYKLADFRKKRNENCVKVLVGNSATESNQHMEVIDWLQRYRSHSIQIYMPLSYGEDTYREIVIQYAQKKLGNRFFPILHYMDGKDYMEFVSQMDIGIFNNNRQQAMGNIQMCLGLGKKVFLREDTSMWKRYLKDGYMIFPIRNIEDMDYEAFRAVPSEMKEKNSSIYDEKESYLKEKSLWETTIKYILGGGVTSSTKISFSGNAAGFSKLYPIQPQDCYGGAAA